MTWGQWSGAWGSGPNFLEITDYLTVVNQIRINNAAGTANVDADDLVIGGTGAGNVGIQFLTSTGIEGIFFGDSADDDAASFRYQHSTDTMLWRWGAVTRMSAVGAAIFPTTDGGLSSGSATNRWSGVWGDSIALQKSAVQDNATYNLGTAASVVRVNAATGAVNLQLPASTTSNDRTWFIYVTSVANTVTLLRNGTDTINGAAADDTFAATGLYIVTSTGDGDNLSAGPAALT